MFAVLLMKGLLRSGRILTPCNKKTGLGFTLTGPKDDRPLQVSLNTKRTQLFDLNVLLLNQKTEGNLSTGFEVSFDLDLVWSPFRH